jgi:adenine-specific DNA-methyltransferase
MMNDTADQPEKLPLRSMDISAEKRIELLRLFPEVRTEGNNIDFDRLKLALGASIDAGRERYGLTWPGKADCFKSIQAPSLGTLRPALKESLNWDSTENLIIEGDNLEVLKLLQKAYLGKIKMIYIDPPYNTGNDFIYPDNFGETLQTYLEYTGQIDQGGRKFGTNTETDGRFHTNWLNMMYPRLYLARNLLREDGVIFVSIDDSELLSLRFLMNEIFGEDQFVSQIIIQSNKRGQTYKDIAKTHEYVVMFSKTEEIDVYELDKVGDGLPYNDSIGAYDLWELRNRNPKFGRHNRPNLFYPIFVNPNEKDESGLCRVSVEKRPGFTEEALPRNSEGADSCWRWGKETVSKSRLDTALPDVVARQTRDGKWNIYEKSRKSTTKAKSLWTETDVISEQGTMELGELGLAGFFDHPKPLGLLTKCLQIGLGKDDIVLDFFAGSGTTAHAVHALNAKDAGHRKFILVQLPEPTRKRLEDGTYEETAASKAGFENIAAITRGRVSRAIGHKTKKSESTLDLSANEGEGFRVFRLAPSNFERWDTEMPSGADNLGQQLSLHVDHVLEGRTDDDILFEILLKRGFELTTPIEKLTLAKKTVFSVGGGVFLICLDRGITLEAIREMAEIKPSRVVCLDAGFAGNDQLKVNAVQIFKTKGVAKFQTV